MPHSQMQPKAIPIGTKLLLVCEGRDEETFLHACATKWFNCTDVDKSIMCKIAGRKDRIAATLSVLYKADGFDELPYLMVMKERRENPRACSWDERRPCGNRKRSFLHGRRILSLIADGSWITVEPAYGSRVHAAQRSE